jgi:hypothetical protein
MAMEIRSTPSFGGEVKPSFQCRKILRYVKHALRYDRDTDKQTSAISCPISSRFDTRCLLQPEQRTLVDESRGSIIYSKMVANERNA